MELWLKTSVMDLLDWLGTLEGRDLRDYLGGPIELEKQDCFDVCGLLDVPKAVG